MKRLNNSTYSSTLITLITMATACCIAQFTEQDQADIANKLDALANSTLIVRALAGKEVSDQPAVLNTLATASYTTLLPLVYHLIFKSPIYSPADKQAFIKAVLQRPQISDEDMSNLNFIATYYLALAGRDTITGLDNQAGRTLLTIAVREGKINLLKIIQTYALPIIEGIHTRLVDILGAQAPEHEPDLKGMRELMSDAITANQPASIQFLLEQGASLETFDKSGDTPLIQATRLGNQAATRALLEHGAQVEAFNKAGHAALHVAAEHGDTAIIKLLLDFKAPINQETALADTPLHKAVSGGNPQAVKLLVDHGASLTERDWYGDTPLGRAQRRELNTTDAVIDSQMKEIITILSSPQI